MIQTTSLHDILWHFVASLTPSPFEPEDEEDDENKGNKENVEQVMISQTRYSLTFVLLLDLLTLHIATLHPTGKRLWRL